MKINMLANENLVFVLALLGIGAIVLIYFIYKVDAKNALAIKGWKKAGLWACRVLIALMIFFAIMRPSVTMPERKVQDPIMAFVVDQSASMAFPDAPENSMVKSLPKDDRTRFNAAKAVVTQLQGELRKTHDVKVYSFSDTITLINSSQCLKDTLPLCKALQMSPDSFHTATRSTAWVKCANSWTNTV